MAGRITQASLQRLRDAVNIVDVVSGYVTLKRSGNSFKGLCPFHDEKTPSFSVSPERGWFHCFGCGEKGSAIDFVMALDRVSFPEAVEMLADRAGIVLEREAGGPARDENTSSTKSDVFRVNRWAAEFYRRHLLAAGGEACRAYLKDRGFTEETLKTFKLGYAPSGWSALCDAARRKGIQETLLLASGLAKKREGGRGVYDAFRDRLIFPIFDALERVIGFGGRSLDGSEPKYLNSPKTPVFNKSASLYGLDRLKRLKADEHIYVMEGYTDVIMARQAANLPAVATLGTALTVQHARLLGRYSEHIVLVYDGDSAGRRAAERGAELFCAVDLDVKVARLAQSQDPCEFLLERGEEGAELMARGAMPFFDFVLGEVCERHDTGDVTGRVKAADELLVLARATQNPVKRGLLLDRIAEALTLARADLEARLALTERRQHKEAGAAEDGEAPRPPGSRPVPVDRPVTRAGLRAERHVLGALVNGAGVDVPWQEKLRAEDFATGRARDLFTGLLNLAPRGPLPQVDEILMALEEGEGRQFLKDLVAIEPPEEGRLKAQLEGGIAYFIGQREKRELGALKAGGVSEDNFAAIVEKMKGQKASPEESQGPRGPRPEGGEPPWKRPVTDPPPAPTDFLPPVSGIDHDDDDDMF